MLQRLPRTAAVSDPGRRRAQHVERQVAQQLERGSRLCDVRIRLPRRRRGLRSRVALRLRRLLPR